MRALRARTTLAAVAALLAPACGWGFDTGQLGQGGSLTLDDRMALIEKTPKLRDEVKAELAKVGKKPEDITCDAARFSGQWRHLGGERVAPYICDFGEKWLRIRADVRVTDSRGRAYEKATPEATRNAQHISETNLRWTWSEDDPHGKD